MTEQQLYIAVGAPTIVALIGILVNIGYFVALNGRVQALETRLDGRMDRLEAKFDLLIGKVIEIHNRLTRVEEHLKHLH